jgi:pimeloyl-ACP methyl ester carboxylesterase
MSMGRGKIEPFYFGPSAQPLFGLYHAPRPDSSRRCAIVMCYPLGHEYIQFHRAFRLLGDQLCSADFPVLRFDFYGCGDSSGESEDGRTDQWLSDLSAAIAEIRRRAGVTRICLVGLRLGASLAMIAAAEHGDVDGLALWDPVINGKVYVDELKALHRQMLRTAHVVAKPSGADERFTEVLGFPLSDQLIADIETINLLTVGRTPAAHTLIIQSHPKVSVEGLKNLFETRGASAKFQYFPSPQLWEWNENFGKILIPYQTLQAIVGWAREVYP